MADIYASDCESPANVTEVEGNICICNIPEYADNAAAKSGGLVDGQMYRTGDLLKIVHS